jgi:hypothetical protein
VELDPRVARLTSREACETFARNADKLKQPALALQARQKAVRLQAASHGAATDAEREGIEAVYAYERILSAKRGRTVRASRTWQMIDRHGILPAIERIVTRRDDALGFQALVDAGFEEFAFESVVLRNPAHFSEEAIEASRKRLDRHG